MVKMMSSLKRLRQFVLSTRRLRSGAISIMIAMAFQLPTCEAAERADSGDSSVVRNAAEWRLQLHQTHTGESIDVAYKRAGQYLPDGIALLNHFLRDYRTGDDADYDPREFDLLHAILQRLSRPRAVIDVICGYRTPETNHFLRSRSNRSGVAENSQHMESKAIDIRIPGVKTATLREAALSLAMGGVGYYPISQFVHVDVGPVRSWSFGELHFHRAAYRAKRSRLNTAR